MHLKLRFVKSQKKFFHFRFGLIFICFLLKQLLWGGEDEVIIGDKGERRDLEDTSYLTSVLILWRLRDESFKIIHHSYSQE